MIYIYISYIYIRIQPTNLQPGELHVRHLPPTHRLLEIAGTPGTTFSLQRWFHLQCPGRRDWKPGKKMVGSDMGLVKNMLHELLIFMVNVCKS